MILTLPLAAPHAGCGGKPAEPDTAEVIVKPAPAEPAPAAPAPTPADAKPQG